MNDKLLKTYIFSRIDSVLKDTNISNHIVLNLVFENEYYSHLSELFRGFKIINLGRYKGVSCRFNRMFYYCNKFDVEFHIEKIQRSWKDWFIKDELSII